MPKHIQGILTAEGYKFGIVISRFNEFISNKLLEGALDCLYRHQAAEADIKVFWTPGSFEMPLVASKLAHSKQYHGIICLGAIIRGATPHFEYIASEVAKGIANTSLQTGIPIILGVITSDTIEQAIERAGTKAGNKGWDAALSAIEMVNLLKKIE